MDFLLSLWYGSTMAQSAQVAKLSIRHEAILHFLLANPTISKGEVAERFSVTEAWLSVICNSQAFLEARANYTEEVFHETVLPLREKMMIAADRALDRINALVPRETDLDKVRKTAESVLASCGFGTGNLRPTGPQALPGVNIQNNFYGNASPAVVERARQRIGVTIEAQTEPAPVLEVSLVELGVQLAESSSF